MRRLWAHAIIAFTCIVAVFAAFPSVIRGIKTNGDYETRRQFTFQLTERNQEEGDTISLTDNSAKDMAKIMEQRLINSDVTSYEISTEGNDIVNVAFSADTSTEYLQITTYLGFSGSFALMNQDPDSEPIVASEFLNGSAYIVSDVNQYPTIVIPVKTDSEAYKSLIEWAKTNLVESEADEDGNTTQSAPVYIIYNYVEGDTYKTLTDNNKFNEKILITLDATSEDTLYYNDEHNSFAQICGFSDSNGNGYADEAEVAAAYSQAKFIYNLFNATALDYDVDVIKGIASGTEVWLNAKVERVVYQDKIIWNSTLTAFVATIVVALLLAYFYRLGAISVTTTSVASAFLGFLFMVLAGVEYNGLAVVAFIALALLSLISGVLYLSRLKDEAYRGRTMKKANSEAARKSLMPIIDIHVVAAAIGLMLYLLGGAAVHSFAVILILGSLASVLINTIGLRGLMWLATNATALNGRYEFFGIEKDKVPNHMADEKQSYFGPHADRDFFSKKKLLSIIGGALFAISVLGIGLMGGLNGGNLFRNAPVSTIGSDIYVVDTIRVLTDEESKLNEDIINELLNDIKVYNQEGETVTFDDTDTHATLASYVEKTTAFVTSESEVVEGTTYNYSHYYFVLKLSQNLDGDKLFAKVKDYDLTSETSLNGVLEIFFSDINDDYDSGANSLGLEKVKTYIDLKKVETYSNEQTFRWEKVTLATFISTLIVTVYFLIRYRLSRGLASLVFPIAASAVTLGLMLIPGLIGLALPSSTAILVPMTTLFAYMVIVIISSKERDLIADDKGSRDNSLEHRQEISRKAVAIGYTSLIEASVLGAYLAIDFFGFGPSVYSYIFLAILFGVLISHFFITGTYLPLANVFYKWFSKINFEIKPRKNKKTNVVKTKSAEPEEAIFIGIND